MTARGPSIGIAAALACAALAAALVGPEAGCGTSEGRAGPEDGGAPADVVVPRTLDGTTGVSRYGCADCGPFPEMDAPPCDPATFAAPVVAYPVDGMVVPPNLPPPEVQFTASPGATLYELDWRSAIADVRVVAKCDVIADARGGSSVGCGVTVPRDAWHEIAEKNRGLDPVRLAIRATKDGRCVSTSAGRLLVAVANEDLEGTVYVWRSAANGGVQARTAELWAHDLATADWAPQAVYRPAIAGTCVGCHTISTDGKRMALTTAAADGVDAMNGLHVQLVDLHTREVLGGAAMSPGFQCFTHDHQELVATTFSTQDTALQVLADDGTNVRNAAVGGLHVTQPDLHPSDNAIVYVVPQSGSISTKGDHHFMSGSLYTSAIDTTAGVVDTPQLLIHAPTTAPDDAGRGGRTYYYPSFSPNGALVVFDEAEGGDAFYNRDARVKLLHFPGRPGADPLDLVSLNGPPGSSNSQPRWSPFVQRYLGVSIAWMVFASTRDYGLHLGDNSARPNCYPPQSPDYDQPQLGADDGCALPQIWIAAVVVDPAAELDLPDRSFGAFWLPGQDLTSHHHGPQWVEGAPPAAPASCVNVGGGCDAANRCCVDSFCCKGTCAATCDL